MSAKTSGQAVQQFVEKVKSCNIVQKQNELKNVISGPLAVARDKIQLLETDEAATVLARIDPNYHNDLKENVEGIFYEEVERGNLILQEIDGCLFELHALLETIGQRITNEDQASRQISSMTINCFEDARYVLMYLKLRTNEFRLKLSLSVDENVKNSTELESQIEDVTIYENGSTSEGRVIPILSSMTEFLQRICDEFGCPEYNRVYNSTGAVISDINLIRDEEILYVSRGEPFSPRVKSEDILVSDKVAVDASSTNCIFHWKNSSDWVKLNVGGQLFYTSRTTLLNSDPDSMLARMFSPSSNLHPGCIDSNGAYLIDRDPRYFSPLLNYLRSGALILDPDINPKGVLEEAYFFNIQSCIPLLEPLTIPRDEAPLTRRDVINALIVTPNKDSLRFQGVNLNGADLSYLDLRNINFKYAKLRSSKLSYCNLSFCNFERADMTDIMMNCAVLSGVRLNGAIMENAKCLNCNFQDPSGHNANMEGVNLRNAVLEDSDLTGANLRVANLKGANLKATILRGAILAGADLEKSDLTGSDLHEANLRGANLKDAALELMINPLHMSQAIR